MECEDKTFEDVIAEYYDRPDMFEQIRDLKRCRGNIADFCVLANAMTDDRAFAFNMFFKYYMHVDVSEVPKLLPEGAKLRGWQEKVFHWAIQPITEY